MSINKLSASLLCSFMAAAGGYVEAKDIDQTPDAHETKALMNGDQLSAKINAIAGKYPCIKFSKSVEAVVLNANENMVEANQSVTERTIFVDAASVTPIANANANANANCSPKDAALQKQAMKTEVGKFLNVQCPQSSCKVVITDVPVSEILDPSPAKVY